MKIPQHTHVWSSRGTTGGRRNFDRSFRQMSNLRHIMFTTYNLIMRRAKRAQVLQWLGNFQEQGSNSGDLSPGSKAICF